MTLPAIGTRIELVSMDAGFQGISIGFYRQDRADGPVGLVHTYSPKPGAAERVEFVARAMAALGGLDACGDSPARLRFDCGAWHERASRRVFLEACKADPAETPAPPPLEVTDRRSGQRISVDRCGAGLYRVQADGGAAGTPSRAPAVARGLAKLADLETTEEPTEVRFPCGADHDALIGILLPRALNVRAATREDEARASRGVLAAPSQQQAQQEG